MENFRIESLEINKIGAFEHIKMDFPKKTDPDKAEIHILTGENGTGKSTILEALKNLGLSNREQEKYKIFAKIISNENESCVSINTSHSYDCKYWERKVSSKEPMPTQLVDFRRYALNTSITKPLNFAMFAYSGYRRTQDVKISGIKEISESPLENSLNFDKSINTESLQQWIFNTDYRMLSALRSKDEIASKNIYKHITVIQTILTLIIEQDLILEISAEDFKLNIVLSSNSINQNIIPFDNLPDGLKSMISWIGDLLMRMDRLKWKDDLPIFERNFILFLDEIEVHLHPAWQRKILPVVQKLFKNAQIFISTHSPFVVGSVDGAWIHKLKKDGAFAVLDGKPVLSEDAESYDTILDEIFGIKERFGDEIEDRLEKFRDITKEILKGDEHRLKEWQSIISFFKNQERPDEIMSYITPQIRQINRIRNQVLA